MILPRQRLDRDLAALSFKRTPIPDSLAYLIKLLARDQKNMYNEITLVVLTAIICCYYKANSL